MTVITPIIHMNGDRKETLVGQLQEAYTAVRAAQKALKDCAGNQRNFYPAPGRWEQYRRQHATREDHLQAVCESLRAEVAKIYEETTP